MRLMRCLFPGGAAGVLLFDILLCPLTSQKATGMPTKGSRFQLTALALPRAWAPRQRLLGKVSVADSFVKLQALRASESRVGLPTGSLRTDQSGIHV